MDARAADGSPPVGKTILVVEDEVGVGKMLSMLLRSEQFEVHLATNGSQAVELFRQHGAAIDLVLMDIRMPGQDGVQTLAALQTLNPRVRCCFMSGETGQYTIPALLATGAIDVILKPFYDLAALKRSIREMLTTA